MRTLGNRRAVLSAGVAIAAAVALAGCSAGQVAETAIKRSSSPGVTINNSNNSVGIRNLAVTFNGVDGYPAGSNAPLQVGLFNLTTQEVTVLISSTPPAASSGQTVVGASSVEMSGGSTAFAPSGTPSGATPAEVAPSGVAPSGAAPSGATPSGASPSGASSSGAATPIGAGGQPARIILPPLGSASFLPGDPQQLQVVGLTNALTPGYTVNVTFEFSNGAQTLTLQAPVAPPLSPAPRGSTNPAENHEIGG